MTNSDWQGVTLARIVRDRGRIGEVAAEILTDFPARLAALREVWLVKPEGGSPERRAVRRCWLHKGQAIFHFQGINTISQAKSLIGRMVQVPLEQRVTLPQGHFFISDLVGCEVWESAPGGAKLGVVNDVATDTGTPVLIVGAARGELLIPFAVEICVQICPVARRIEVRLPEGLLDLNPPGESSSE